MSDQSQTDSLWSKSALQGQPRHLGNHGSWRTVPQHLLDNLACVRHVYHILTSDCGIRGSTDAQLLFPHLLTVLAVSGVWDVGTMAHWEAWHHDAQSECRPEQ